MVVVKVVESVKIGLMLQQLIAQRQYIWLKLLDNFPLFAPNACPEPFFSVPKQVLFP